MATLKWKEDYGQYKKGDTFELNAYESMQYLIEQGKLEVVSEKTRVVNAEDAAKEQQEEMVKAASKPNDQESEKPAAKTAKK